MTWYEEDQYIRNQYRQFQDIFLMDIVWYWNYEELKSSFFPELTIYKLPLSQIFLGACLFLPSFPLFHDFGLSLWTFLFSWAFFVLWGWLVFSGYTSFRRITVYKQTLYYLEIKDSIIQEREKLEMNIFNDMEKSGVDIATLWNIKKYISFILKWYKIISESHLYIQNHIPFFGQISKEWQIVINNEFQWIINYSEEFTLLVQSWISHHTTELAELERQIQAQEMATENEGGKAALEFSRISLQEHLKELEKVRI